MFYEEAKGCGDKILYSEARVINVILIVKPDSSMK